MADRHHIDPDARIQSIHLRNPRNFRCRQANTNRKQSVLSVGQQSEIEYRCLQKCRQTSRNDLLAPAVKSVCEFKDVVGNNIFIIAEGDKEQDLKYVTDRKSVV